MQTKYHYDHHLAHYYTWMYGGSAARFEENESFFRKYQILPISQEKLALDIGAGSGFQTIPLAQMGFQVVAIDFSPVLLQELKSYATRLPVTIVEQDITEVEYSAYTPELVVCMVDTILHLESIEAVGLVIHQIYKALLPAGKFIVSFRDLSYPPEGDNRFIPVKSEKDKLFTCFLEDAGNKVLVHDLVHIQENGQWTQKVSSYKKLKLKGGQMQELLEKTGFKVQQVETIRGLLHFIAIKS